MEIDVLVFLIIIVILLILIVIFQILKKGSVKTEEISQIVNESIYMNISDSEKRISNRFDNLNKSIGEIEGETRIFGEIGMKIKEILSAERRRGKLGEIMIENILNDVLPSSCWERQHALSTGQVDIIVKTKEFIIPIDCKFPLNNYEKFVSEENLDNKKSHLKKFFKDVKKRIDETSKYVIPSEDTTNYALMYVPAESIFLTILEDDDMIKYSMEKFVLICSPITLFYIMHAVNETIKRESLPEKIKALYNEFLRLKEDINGFVKFFDTLGSHIRKAFNKYNEAEGQVKKIQGRASTLILEKE